MADYASRLEGEILSYIDESTKRKGEHLVSNRQMDDKDVHWHRGFIAGQIDVGLYMKNELKKKLDKE